MAYGGSPRRLPRCHVQSDTSVRFSTAYGGAAEASASVTKTLGPHVATVARRKFAAVLLAGPASAASPT